MKTSLFIISFLPLSVFAQLEITTGFAENRLYANGAPIQVAYDFKIKNRFFTKSQMGFKYLYQYNDFVHATMKVRIWEFHQTLSYEVIKKNKYILKPNIGLNYRFYKWKAKMLSPIDELPIRAWVIGVREGNFVLESIAGKDYKEYAPSNVGFSIQLQNQFRLSNKLWLHITPFIEPDYDGTQNTGGCYVGIIFKQL